MRTVTYFEPIEEKKRNGSESLIKSKVLRIGYSGNGPLNVFPEDKLGGSERGERLKDHDR